MIVSDHGMTSGGANSGAEYVEIDDYLDMDDVSHVIDRAAVAAVAPLPGKADKVRTLNSTFTYHFPPYIVQAVFRKYFSKSN